jgi:DNA adenine methylase
LGVNSPGAEPLLKWAGGKRQLLPWLRRFYPPSFGRYIEPFLGSGAVFFDLHRAGRLRDREAILLDSNGDLIGCYEMVRDDAAAVVAVLDQLADGHRRGGRAHYYEVRDRLFNPAREARRRADGSVRYTPELAAMLIYLNRTGFNGLFRVNSNGGFNVPAGRYDRPRIVDRERLVRVSHALADGSVRMHCASFERVGRLARKGDFLYIDPPYAPVGPTANFTGYTAAQFGLRDQERLQRLVIALARRGCYVLVSNSTAAEIGRLYEADGDVRAAGLRSMRVPARRAVNRRADGRGLVEEYLITNIDDRLAGSQAGSRQAGRA